MLYGTAWKEDDTRALVEAALAAGFTGIDTANQRKHYHEAAVGEALAAALRQGGIKREGLFLQTKFTHRRGQDHRLPYDPDAPSATQVQQSFASSLEHLGTTYVDSYLLHGPTLRFGIADQDWEVWRAMERLAADGRARSIGLSNVSLEQLRGFHAGATVKPAYVQNRCYASTRWDADVRAFCTANGITYQGFSLLTANRDELRQPKVLALAERLGRPVPAVVFAFARRIGILALTGTTNTQHMRDDLASAELELAEADVEMLLSISGR